LKIASKSSISSILALASVVVLGKVVVMNVVVDSRGARFSAPRSHVEGLSLQCGTWERLLKNTLKVRTRSTLDAWPVYHVIIVFSIVHARGYCEQPSEISKQSAGIITDGSTHCFWKPFPKSTTHPKRLSDANRVESLPNPESNAHAEVTKMYK
jgi:hypothetical protein